MNGHADAGAPEPPPILVAAFLAASLEALQFLRGEPGFHTSVTIEQLREDQFVEVSADVVTGPFTVRRTFGTRRLAGTMTYGERELEANLLVSRRLPLIGALGPYALWEWVAAFEGAARWQGTGSWLSTAERVRQAVTELGTVFREAAPRIAEASIGTARWIDADRARRRAEEAADHQRSAHEAIRVRANEAFRTGDFATAITLLESLGDRRTPAEQMKLALARKRL
jgi:hypothetical protein